MVSLRKSALVYASLLFSLVRGFDLDVTSKTSICSGATDITNGIMDYYEGYRYGGTVGEFQSPYYWWLAGEVFGGMIDTWYFCQNDTYEETIYNALIAQKGDKNNYIPSNQSFTEGNDDQGFWGFAVMGAVERNFTNPTSDDDPSWLELAQAVYNTMWARWDNTTCDGGLRWQIFTWNNGYNYKNTISNGCLFHMAARLGRYLDNDTYADTASTVWDWMEDVGFVVESGDSISVYDGADIVDDECPTVGEDEWTYNYGILIAGCSYLYNMTGESKWEDRATSLFNGISIFLKDNVMYERQCQDSGTCNNDQRSFKSIFSRSLGMTAVLVPSLYDKVYEVLTASAQGAAQSCSGGTDNVTCGQNWSHDGWDGVYGLGEQISALECIQNLLIDQRPGPYKATTGGSSKSNPDAGLGTSTDTNANEVDIVRKDKVGAGILTAVVLVAVVSTAVWMVI
ncbi:unnamed protein product [Kuraishia capsulata CBS 1993]|uniref:Mannan endo-1,6-alpha-mannosidase n=1 Tax=Kuraishia capsulata CBS 1993 TaxID=1382522 RepID=W6MFN4_9ASCO|nr:uncharacterized protein KUCA_T00000388001 [Kuraishia capsulata CBS 1993]CDK24426.1 unnamed protein product [Kuraishia capsulata CBS 1993]